MSKRVRYMHSMVDFMEDYVASGLVDNADVARILASAYDAPITAADVAQWRRQYPRFDRRIINGLDELRAEAVGVVVRAIRENDVTTAKWLLERRHPDFKPSSKVDMNGRLEGMEGMLARRVTEAELRKQGILIDDDEDGSDSADEHA